MTIGRQKAVEIFLAGSIKAKLTLSRIERWDTKKTLKENAADIGIQYQDCVELAGKYHLEYVKIKNFRF